MRASNLQQLALPICPHNDVVAVLRNAADLHIHVKANPFPLQDFANGIRNIRVLSLDQARPPLQNCDLAAEPPEHLPKLQANVASAYDEEMPGKKIRFHHGAIRELRNRFEPGNVRHDSAASHVYENPVRAEPGL